MGTWIETAVIVTSDNLFPVVPLVGTWIETARVLKLESSAWVVPLVGTWIETEKSGIYTGWAYRRFPRGNVDCRSPRGNIHWNCLIGCGIGKDRAMLVLSSDIVYPLYEEYTNNIEIKMKRACKSIRF